MLNDMFSLLTKTYRIDFTGNINFAALSKTVAQIRISADGYRLVDK